MSKKINNTPRRLLTTSMSLALLISLSSCSGATNTTGNIEANKIYASTGAGDKQVAVTYGELWNELQWSANTVLNEQITNVILNEKISKISQIVNATKFEDLGDSEKLGVKKEDFENVQNSYKERLVDYVVQDIYDQTFSKDGYWKAIEAMDANTRKVSIEKYIDSMYLTYHKYFKNDRNTAKDVLFEAGENQTGAFLDLANEFKDVYYPLLAKELLAYDHLDEKILEAEKEDDDPEDDKEGYFTHTQVKNKFESEYSNKYDLNLVAIRFTSEKEFEDTLRAFGIKIHNKEYFFIKDSTEKGKTLSYQDYIKRYDEIKDYDKNNGVEPLSDYQVFELYIQLYNYIYGGYKGKLPSAVDFNFSDINNLRHETNKHIMERYNVDEKKDPTNPENPSQQGMFEANVEALKAKNETKYDSQKLTDISASFKDYAYETLKTPEDGNPKGSYSTTTQSANSGYYIAYKFDDAYDELQDGSREQKYEQYFKENEELTAYEVYKYIFGDKDDLEKYPGDKLLQNEILKMLKDDQLTDTLINDALTEEKKEIKVKIYNEALEISYKKDNPDYSKTLKGADKNLLASISYNDKTYNLNIKANNDDANSLKSANGQAIGAFDILEQKLGSTTAIDLISDEIIKSQPAYDEAKKDKENIKYYEEYLDTLLVNFANGGLAAQGYDASIGKYDFLMLYFHTADVNKIVEDYFLVQHAASKLLTDYSSTALAQFFKTYSDMAYDNYFSLSGSRLVVYMDTDEDNEADDSSTWATKKVMFKGEELTRAEIAKQLVLEMYNKVAASTVAHKDRMTQLVDEFNGSARAEYDGNPIAPENNWSEYRHLGFKLKVEEFATTNTDVEIDRNLKNRLYAYATDEKYDFFKNGQAPTAYMEKLTEENKDQIVQTEDGFNLILVTAGQSKPSAKFEEKNNQDNLLTNITFKYNGSYIDPIKNVYNSEDKLTEDQIRLFLVDNAVNGASTMSPTSTSGALTTFLQPVLQRYSSAETQRIILLSFIKEVTLGSDDTTAIYDVIKYDDKSYNGENNYLNNVITISQNIVDNYVSIYNDPQTNIFKGWWEGIQENVSNFINNDKEASK